MKNSKQLAISSFRRMMCAGSSSVKLQMQTFPSFPEDTKRSAPGHKTSEVMDPVWCKKLRIQLQVPRSSLKQKRINGPRHQLKVLILTYYAYSLITGFWPPTRIWLPSWEKMIQLMDFTWAKTCRSHLSIQTVQRGLCLSIDGNNR